MRKISFFLLALTAVILAVVSPFFTPAQYSSPLMVTLWGALAISATIYIFRRRLFRRPSIFMLHAALILILGGGLVTCYTADHYSIHLRNDEKDAVDSRLPFPVSLSSFTIDYYPGGSIPRAYTAIISIDGRYMTLSLNNIINHSGYRFMLKSFDSDNKGVTISVNHDPAGITVTYAGYVLLLLSMIAYFFTSGTIFRRAIRQLATLAIIIAPVTLRASPLNIPQSLCSEISTLPVSYNGHITPFASFSNDVLNGIHGSSSYAGMDATEVVSSMIFNFNSWVDEPVIKVRNHELKKILGIGDSSFASYNNWIDAISSGRIDREDISYANDLSRYATIEMIASGRLLKIFPLRDDTGTTGWYSPADDLPLDSDNDKWLFTRKFISYLTEPVIKGETTRAMMLIGKLKQFQLKEAPEDIPAHFQLELENCYTRYSSLTLPGILSMILGIIFISLTALTGCPRIMPLLAVALVWLWLTLLIAARWFITSTVPLTNGFETMQFMAWATLLMALVICHRWSMALPLALIISGLAMIASMAAGGGNSISPIMPVLASPLLSIHVVVIMVAYSLLAFMMLNGVLALTIARKNAERLAAISTVMLAPALFLLTSGIFIGAVWANVSWGRYWGWDPKEVWALVTMIVYSFPMHQVSLRWFSSPRHLHIYYVTAFLSVLITYFGANFILSGLHSYA